MRRCVDTSQLCLSLISVAALSGSGSQGPLLAPGPLGTGLDTFASSGSSRSKGPLVGPAMAVLTSATTSRY